MVDEIILKPNELLEIKGDRIFHDMFNEYEMDTIEWLVMKILNCNPEMNINHFLNLLALKTIKNSPKIEIKKYFQLFDA